MNFVIQMKGMTIKDAFEGLRSLDTNSTGCQKPEDIGLDFARRRLGGDLITSSWLQAMIQGESGDRSQEDLFVSLGEITDPEKLARRLTRQTKLLEKLRISNDLETGMAADELISEIKPLIVRLKRCQD